MKITDVPTNMTEMVEQLAQTGADLKREMLAGKIDMQRLHYHKAFIDNCGKIIKACTVQAAANQLVGINEPIAFLKMPESK